MLRRVSCLLHAPNARPGLHEGPFMSQENDQHALDGTVPTPESSVGAACGIFGPSWA